MQVLVSSEHRFDRTPDGAVWTTTVNGYSFWTRYLDVFDAVRVVARVKDVTEPQPKWIRADGPQVTFDAVPHFIGPLQYVRSYRSVRRALIESASRPCAVIMRVPSPLSNTITGLLQKQRYPFALEVVGDPYDVFAPGAVRHPLRPVFRSWFSAKLRQQCLRADGVAYVTTSALQKRYPCRAVMMGISDVILPGEAFTTTYSSVELAPKQIASTGRSGTAANARPRVVFIGSLEQLYKAPEILIEAVARTRSRGLELELSIVGDGRYRPMLESLASKLSLSEHCRFLGQLPGGASVQTVLDDSDLFVLPSRVEGLPRAMIEAMARGLPCIGSTVGGIPELLDPVDLVAPGDAAALASTIEAVLTDPERQKTMSFRNLERARQYEDKILKAKRREFYRHVLRVTRKFQSVSA